MALRNIVKKGDDILRKKCRQVDEINDRVRLILEDMLETMREENGVGLAAPQVGIMRRMFVIEPEPDAVFKIINPEIVETSGEQECNEGCLSVPGFLGTVTRPQMIRIRYTDETGENKDRIFKDFYADVIAHEYDHLEGILFIDKAKDIREVLPEVEEEGNAHEDSVYGHTGLFCTGTRSPYKKRT